MQSIVKALHLSLFASHHSLEGDLKPMSINTVSSYSSWCNYLYFLRLYPWTLSIVLTACLTQFSENSFSLFLLVSFLRFVGILNFIILGPFSQNILLASYSLLLCSVCASGITRAPPFSPSPARVCWLVQKGWLLKASAFAQTCLCNCSGMVLTREEEYVRS